MESVNLLTQGTLYVSFLFVPRNLQHRHELRPLRSSNCTPDPLSALRSAVANGVHYCYP